MAGDLHRLVGDRPAPHGRVHHLASPSTCRPAARRRNRVPLSAVGQTWNATRNANVIQPSPDRHLEDEHVVDHPRALAGTSYVTSNHRRLVGWWFGVVAGMDRNGRAADFRFEFEHSAFAPRDGRRALTGFLSDPDDPLGADVELAATELITNVIRHTNSGGVLEAWDPKPDVPLRLEVSDSAQTAPQVVEDPGPAGGFGLQIINTIADAWGVIPTSTGKVVWAEFDRSKRTS